ncbi:MAG: glutamine amidotransferase [Actinobacteria bacterium]|nr:glutamine amidotransferase [Actinomycetota bacterium]
MELRIAHLYPTMMNIYADRGNIITLVKRCQWRGIGVSVDDFGLGETPGWTAYDFFYLGGGQDREQTLVARDLAGKGAGLVEAVEKDAVLLSICGGYQLLGRYYRTAAGETMPGLGLFQAHTVAGSKRLIGNVVIDSHLKGPGLILAGFENHSGKTFLEEGQQPLGRVISGYGNNSEDRTEGAVYRGAVGTYLHGPLLPKNPELTDFLLERALARRNGSEFTLEPLDDGLERAAHRVAVGNH